MSQNLLVNLKGKKEVHRQWEQEHHRKSVGMQLICVRMESGNAE